MWAAVPLLLVLVVWDEAVQGLNCDFITERGRSWRKRLFGGEVIGAGEELGSGGEETSSGIDVSETMDAGILESIVNKANDRSGKMIASSSSLEDFVFKGLRRSMERILNGYFIVLPEVVRFATDLLIYVAIQVHL